MFDANARYLPLGRLFFGEVHNLSEESLLYTYGLRYGDVILCEMLSKEHDNPTVKFYFKNHTIAMLGDELKWNHGWIVFAGSADGKGFISQDVQNKALCRLGGKWLESSGTPIPPIKNLMEV
tara:strand:- start:7409 stop:7774 length:366 start_codon:yes stop_codon:yes gene_type:complete